MKKKELETELTGLKEQLQLLLLYNTQITKICLIHTNSYKTINLKDLDTIQIADLFLKVNIHAFTAYFYKYFFGKYKPQMTKNEDFLADWNKHMNNVINPIYMEELKKLRETLSGNKEVKSYIS